MDHSPIGQRERKGTAEHTEAGKGTKYRTVSICMGRREMKKG